MKNAIFYSILIHIVLAVLFLFMPVNLSFYTPEFIEVGLLTPARASVPEQEPLSVTKEEEKVSLPETKHEGRLPEKLPTEKEEPFSEMVQEQEIVKETPSLGDAIESKLYTITGEISKRRVINKVIPTYPEGYNIQTEVSYELFVTPDGHIQRIRIVKRGGEVFNKITLDALRQWRFEKLPPNLPQEIQSGIITFIYRLR